MKRLVLACALALCGPAFGNEREDSEAKLAALSGPVIAALGAAMPQVEGMTCGPDTPDPSPTNRLLIPNARFICAWVEGAETLQSSVVVALSASAAKVQLASFAKDKAKLATGNPVVDATRFFGDPIVRAVLKPHSLSAAPSDLLIAQADVPGPGGVPAPAAMDALAIALAAMDTAALEALPEVQAHVAALTLHRGILERQRENLAAVLASAVVGKPATAMLPEDMYPDFMFFGAEPLVQTNTVEAGVAMIVTLTTSSFALENAFADKQFVGRHKNGDMGVDGVFHDRGRVQVYLRDNSMTALIDGRGMLMLYVPDEVAGTDPLAAMEAVLARIAANDFSGY